MFLFVGKLVPLQSSSHKGVYKELVANGGLFFLLLLKVCEIEGRFLSQKGMSHRPDSPLLPPCWSLSSLSPLLLSLLFCCCYFVVSDV